VFKNIQKYFYQLQAFQNNVFWKLAHHDYGTLKNKEKHETKKKMKKNKKCSHGIVKKNKNDFESKTLNNISSLETKKLNININHFQNLHTQKAKQIERCYKPKKIAMKMIRKKKQQRKVNDEI